MIFLLVFYLSVGSVSDVNDAILSKEDTSSSSQSSLHSSKTAQLLDGVQFSNCCSSENFTNDNQMLTSQSTLTLCLIYNISACNYDLDIIVIEPRVCDCA